MTQLTSMCELACHIVQKNLEEKQLEEEQAVKAHNWKLLVCYDDDDDEEGYNSLNDNIIFELPSYSAVTPTAPIDSLSMGDEHLDTIPAMESDEFIKLCVESESEGENECDVLAGFTTFSNVLFDADYDSDSSDDQSLSDEDVPEKIYSNPLFDEEIIPMEIDQHSFNAESDHIESMPNLDFSVIISSKIDSLFDEFAGELTLLKSIPPGIDETDCHNEKEIRFAKRLLYDNSSPRPPKEIVSDNSNADIESFSPSTIPNEDIDSHMEEIDLSFTPDDPMPPGITDDDYDSGRDILILEELLDNYSLSLPANESYHFDIPSPYRPPAKPPDGNTRTLNIKMLGDVSDQKVLIPNHTITRVLNQEKSPDLLSHLGFEAFQPSAECPMIINGKNTHVLDVPLFHFYPHDQLKKLWLHLKPESCENWVKSVGNSHMEEVDLSFNLDDPMPPGIEEDDDDSERDIPILEKLLDNYSLSLPANESYHFDIPSPYRPPAKPPDGNTGTLNIKMMGDIFERKVPIPGLTITHVLNQEKSPDLLSHLGFEAFQPSAECPMIINGKNIPLLDVPLFHFYLLDPL
nr:hypothetical protein [Tanacetum cinerariifolium]